MFVILKYKDKEYKANIIFWDRDSFFIDFNYWSRFVGSMAQKIAEHTTDNWNKFNLVRTEVIKALGTNLDTGKLHLSSSINFLPLNILPSLLTSSLKNLLQDKNPDDINNLFQELLMKVSHESQQYLKDSITVNNLETIKQINKKAKQVLITNDSKENNDLFIKEAGLENCFHEVHAQTNKEQLVDFLKKDDSIFLTGNPFLVNSYLKRGIKNILTIEEIKLISFNKATDNELITINIDGASKGNPGPASIGMVFYKDKQIINEASEFIGIKTNNFAEYTALIRALEISLDKGFNNIMIKSDSELVVNQINKTYKVKDSDIKDLFDKAYSLIEKLNSFKIIHVPREENLKADKLANNALKNNLPISQ